MPAVFTSQSKPVAKPSDANAPVKTTSERDKKAFALRLNAEVFDALVKWADDDLRSLNGQIEYLLREALRGRKRM
jgi:hypothetical protein